MENRLKNASDKPAYISDTGSLRLYSQYENAGEFGVYATVSSEEDLVNAEAWLRRSIMRLTSSPLTQAEITAAREQVLKDTEEMIKKLGFIESRTELVGEGVLFANDPTYYLKRLNWQARISPKELNKVAKQFLRGDGSTVIARPRS